MNKKSVLLAILVLVQTALFAAKGDNSIKGKVIDKGSKQPIEYATAVLISLPDSTIKKSALTDKDGAFLFAGIEPGLYVVRTQFVGYSPATSAQFDSKEEFEVPMLELEPAASIAQVTVTGKKPYIEKKADRTVLNIDESATASGENAYEVLRKAPNVNIDKDDNININGKQGVTVTINDRPTQLSATDLANYLKSVQGNEIEKIEIINTPPARYEAAGNTGVINIKIKKNRKAGLNGSVYAGAKYNEQWGGYGGGSINARKGKTNVYATLYKGVYKGKNDIDITRTVGVNDVTMNMHQLNYNNWEYNNNGFRAGADYDINKNNTIGVLVNGGTNTEDDNTWGDMYFNNISRSLDSTIATSTKAKYNYDNISYNVNYRASLDTTGSSLNVDADYAKYNNKNKTNSSNISYNSIGEQIGLPVLLRSVSPSEIEIKSLKADYYLPMGKSMKLEAGLKYSDVETDNDLDYKKYNGTDYVNDPTRSNLFVYDEKIFAGYASIQYEIGNTSLKGGLRVENTESKGNSITMNKVVTRSYLDFFPSFFVQQKLNDNNSIGLTYNRRLDRPNYSKLNPFVYYIDEYTLNEGNPFLNPQYANNISLNYSWKSIFFSEATYTHTSDVMADVLKQAPGTARISQTTDNLNNLNSFTWTNSINLSPTKWFRSNTNITLSYNEYEYGINQKKSRKSLNAYSNNTFLLPKKFTFELMGWYQSRMLYGTFNIKEMYCVNVGVQKTLLDDKMRVKLSVDDLFNNMRNRATSDDNGISVVSNNKWVSRSVTLNISYRFGSDTVKPSRERKTGLESEANRISSGGK